MKHRGFTLIECVVTLAVVCLLIAILAPMLGASRAQMRAQSSAEKLMSIGQAGSMYAQDNADRIFTYSWRAGETYLMPDGRSKTGSTDAQAGAYQNQEILQRRTGRISGRYKIQSITARVFHRRFSHLVLIDYLDQPIDTEAYIDPSDGKQLYWTANPLDYDFGVGSIFPYENGIPDGHDPDGNWPTNPVRQRWAFSSSYQMVPDAWQQDQGPRYIPAAGSPHLFQGGSGIQLGRRKVTSVLHSANKVWMHEEFDRDRTQHLYFGYDQAMVEKLMFDGSVNNWESGRAAPSVVPEHGIFHWRQVYVPLDRFPLPVGGLGDQTLVSQRFRWTYGGLKGINYGGFSFD